MWCQELKPGPLHRMCAQPGESPVGPQSEILNKVLLRNASLIAARHRGNACTDVEPVFKSLNAQDWVQGISHTKT